MKKNIIYSAFFALLSITSVGCSDSTIDNMFTLSMADRPAQFTLDVNTTNITISHKSCTQTISITATEDWEISTPEDWISLSNNSGKGNYNVELDIKENPKTTNRNGVVRLIGKKSGKETTININQEPDNTPYITFYSEGKQSFYTWEYSLKINFEYSVGESEWKTYDSKKNDEIEFGDGNNKGSLRLRAKNSFGTAYNTIQDFCSFCFGSKDDVYCSGDIRTLVDYENYNTADCSKAKFCNLFFTMKCECLRSAPELPITTLSDHCYNNMFSGCSLLSAPELPAIYLSQSCYESMFQGNPLSEAPKLPATHLAKSCYAGMFRYCSLSQAPELPATTLAPSCYESMFEGCNNLTYVPDLPAKRMEENCYKSMFAFCSSLVNAPKLPATTLAPSCYESMFYFCDNLTYGPDLPALTLKNRCYYEMFVNCFKLKTIKMLAVTLSSEVDLKYWITWCQGLILNEDAEWSSPDIYGGWEVKYEKQNKNKIQDLYKTWIWDNGKEYAFFGNTSSINSLLDALNNNETFIFNRIKCTDDFYFLKWMRQENVEGDDNENAYMVISEDNTIKCYDSTGKEIRSSKFSITETDYNSELDEMIIGKLVIHNQGGILWPYISNSSEKALVNTEYDIIKLTDDELVLCSDLEGFSLGNNISYWRFRTK